MVLEPMRARARDLMQRTGRVFWRGSSDVRRVALTFDDGPDDLTRRFLDVLDRHGVPGTFFIMGDMTERRRGAIAEYIRRGHQVGAHGYDHKRLTTLTVRQIVEQFERTERAIGPVPQGRMWVRPPYGAMNAIVLGTLLARGYTVGMWSFDSGDYMSPTADEIVARCDPDRMQPGEVILFHEGYQRTVDALPTVIERLQAAGYELVTMADLVAT